MGAELGAHVNLSRGKHVRLAKNANFTRNKLQQALEGHMTFKIYSKLDLTNLKDAIDSGETRYQAKLLIPSQMWEGVLAEAQAMGLFKVTGIHCHVQDPDIALDQLTHDLNKLK